MKKRITYIVVSCFLLVFSCIEEIDLKTEVEFESAIVIEATITNEIKTQIIFLSRAYLLEEQGPSPESNAQVNVIGANGTSYQFQETESGRYASTIQFAAEPNTEYQLEITTSDGMFYGSSKEVLTNVTQIDDLYIERGFNENGKEGVSVYLDSFDPIGNSEYYRYAYEETYKIVAPSYHPMDLTLGLELVPKPEQQQICYNTVLSNSIILENTNKFEEDRIDQFSVRFLGRDNYIISHRYSILVKQYIQSSKAHEYYRSLKEISSDSGVLSGNQPGFLLGNIVSINNDKEKTIGFFEVSSVDERRVYFNYADIFPDEQLPPYIVSCNAFSPSIDGVISTLEQGFKFFGFNDAPMEGDGPYLFVAPPCGNCTVLGNNYPPDFWEE